VGQRIVKSYPSPRLMETIGATNSSATEAIGELIANSFDAAIPGENLDIKIVIDKDGSLSIIDNAKGMDDNVLEKAVIIAEDMSKHIERGESTKGFFGMGFKTACSTLGKFYEIYTRPGNGQEYHVKIDIEEYSTRPSDNNAWDITIDTENVRESSPLRNLKHGTAFIIKKLKKTIEAGPIIDYIGEAFKGHLELNDTITVVADGEEHLVHPKEYSFVEGSKVDINLEFQPGKFITGWVALDIITHNDGLYGFNIYRNKQLVERWNKDWFTPHLMTSRIIGEANLNFLEATFYKQGLQKNLCYNEATNRMKEFLKDVVKASRSLSRKGNISSPAERKKIVNEMRDSYGLAKIDQFQNASPATQEKSGRENSKSINEVITTQVSENQLILDDGTTINIKCVEKSHTDLDTPFDFTLDDFGDNIELQVVIYSEHPLVKKVNNSTFIRIIATQEAIFRALIRDYGKSHTEAFKIKTEWLNERMNNKGA
jgi:hypothetical protein